ncbi:MAG: PilW family protein [Burkholderiales bacterium]|jgi:type IV pilus assembly protein PilW|nr:PilW family protein [Burkholderiales bacterium]
MRQDKRQKGFSLVELMVGVVVGMLAIYASYRIFENVETNYRATETTNEVQMAGLYATFAVSQELSNAGAGVMSNFESLRACPAMPFPTAGATSSNLSLYPLPAAIIPTDDEFLDDLFAFYGTGRFTDLPMSVIAVDPSGVKLSLQAPLGLMAGSVLVAATGGCAAFSADGVTVPDSNGVITVTVGAGQSLAGVVSAGNSLIDLGNAVRRRFFVDGNETLQMQVWQVNSSVGNNNWHVTRTIPIASNVVAFKAQYGVASVPGKAVDTWMAPDATTLDQIVGGTPSVRDIKAVRFGMIVRAAEPDPTLAGAPNYTETLLGGSVSVPLTVSEGSPPLFGWRYRKYETTVALQNTIWN